MSRKGRSGPSRATIVPNLARNRMDLLVIRHARAQEPKKFGATGQDDAARPLTAEGIRRMKKAARGLRSLVPSIDFLISSPIRRAVETAQIIAEAYGGLTITKRDELSPGADRQSLIK